MYDLRMTGAVDPGTDDHKRPAAQRATELILAKPSQS